jgi:hypothetical protein
MYGGSAIGGVVNDRQPHCAGPADRTGQRRGELHFDSQNDLSAGGALMAATSASRCAMPTPPQHGLVRARGRPCAAIRGEPGPRATAQQPGDAQSYGLGGTVFFGDQQLRRVQPSQFDTDYGTVADQRDDRPPASVWNFAEELR